jgi:endonuclease/exonuclease/phosphatase family metal-dependent hydrolase
MLPSPESRPIRAAARALTAVALALLAAIAGVARVAADDTLTVVSLNLWHDQREWPKRADVIIAAMRRLEPDVLCLQEVLQHERLRNQAETLADSLGYAVHFTSVDSAHHVKRYGNAILTRHRVVRAGSRNLAPADDYRTAAHVRIDFRGRTIDVYDTHLHHTREGGAIRATQIRDLLAFVDSSRGNGAVVLAGDFNAEPETPEMALLAPGYVNAFTALHPRATRAEARTFNPVFGGDPGQIDHVLVGKASRPRLTPLACEVLFRTPAADSVWASDHFGVIARLAVAAGR